MVVLAWVLLSSISIPICLRSFLELLFTEEVGREVSARGPNLTVPLIASHAQADTSPTGVSIALVDGALRGAVCHFRSVLGTWGYQEGDLFTCIAACEYIMIITTLATSGTEFVVDASCGSLIIQPIARTHQGYLVKPVSGQNSGAVPHGLLLVSG